MGRTQIYLTDEELELLERQKHATGASRSELVRRAIHSTYGPRERPWPRSIGIASGATITGEEVEEWLEREWIKDID